MARLASLRIGILATVCATLIRLVNSNPVQTTTVKPGQCIQAAIDAAKPGTTIVVKAGTYAEQLTIKKDGIALVGQKGTILIPPTPQIPDAKQNECFGTAGPGRIAGICVAGKALVLEKWDPVAAEHQKVTSVGRRVKGVSITGFEIRGFSGENIALYGAENASVKKTTLVDGLRYGFLTAGSKDTDARGNKVYSTGLVQDIGFRFIALCSDNESGATVWNNDIDNYGIGLCVQTNRANIQHNHVTNSCYGVFVDPGVDGAIVRHNDIGPTNPNCATDFFVGSGIVLFGTTNAEVEHNTVVGQNIGSATTPTNVAAGIAVFDASPEQLASGNQVIRNDLSQNQVDIAFASDGTGNVFKKNTCTSSFPTGLCT